MGQSTALLCAVLTAGCGRIGFGAQSGSGADSTTDAITDSTPEDATPAKIAWVKQFAQRHLPSGTSDDFTVTASAGHAVVLQVACASGSTPSMVTVTAPGWTFTPIDPIFNAPAQTLWAATFGAIAPDAVSTVVHIAWTVADCDGGLAELGDEFTNTDPTGGATTFDAHIQTQGTGNCNATATTGHPDEALWGACLALMLTSAGASYTVSADDHAGDLSEYKLTNDPAGTAEVVTFVNPSGFLLSAVTIKPE